ncbi:hypothetical protein CC1G_15415 [Coprinopsis cinerea okayama7|uniref:Uncharacterized protein n=1 Tax=Coprinopsis cinerea (strain Okayama-7 / 130 / ATCC MYA-4618 / FGSC 9003) TaxID=240176 RepID=D6RQS9_COPC7|nr:hypothetical protein CC1G_15415 [Coprinopsis cinerea okayama7\|eukprot:XP_002910137.1 hypothetical protein CC1G_15415 [Coprinopsis cinerea okayama7\
MQRPAAYDEGDDVVVTKDVVTPMGKVSAGAQGSILEPGDWSEKDKCYKYRLKIKSSRAAIGGHFPGVPEDAIELLFEE